MIYRLILMMVAVITLTACTSIAPGSGNSDQPAEPSSQEWLRNGPRSSAIGKYAGAAVTVDSNGVPTLLALDESNLVFVRCGDRNCVAPHRRTIGTVGPGGNFALTSVGSAPLIAFTEARGAPITLVRCRDNDCSQLDEKRLDFALDFWQMARIGDDLIFVTQHSDGSLLHVRCPGSDCSEPVTSPIDRHDVELYGVAAAKDAVWIFSIGAGRSTVQVRRCNSSECAPVPIRIGAVDSEHVYRIATPAYHDRTPSAILEDKVIGSGSEDSLLRLIVCSSRECSVAPVDSSLSVQTHYTRPALRPNGLAVVAFEDSITGALKLAWCDATTCANARLLNMGNGHPYDVTVGPDDLPMIVSNGKRDGSLTVTRCYDRFCGTRTSTIVDLRAGQH